ncbi:zinc-ribbon and DUF3426 domain-containing protein [Cocleimonas sp. KMM 6892]|uniref:zinc-ribbon and DUF3426 domain-containing protein n=1 Tax=unclassified Cocleimonas TaxID=2639732 RepID=UPI002DB82CB8|nr:MULTISPECIES: zinc-ribbon and DUF3426 domain-containing protein [unclassified Cocleimonas]MEB8433776.1 zinc-ribbon and DUF3426 domain-containing protein [Cocleimonas sp. KMM 6892]MEC4716587.1 zinc-ribbon and DUF3426 domain-containing protein [Cocleimonas sp. KMM 6895]MEC4746258.1 zinc-ribbon and DUF3426 domain-containing protein [Cocleimonas sp. KMM 6896]
MFTQCEHCKAIFEINMREVTIAKGMLRCGECHQVFNGSKTLSTNMPEPYSDKKIESAKTQESKKPEEIRHTDIITDNNKDGGNNADKTDKKPAIKGVEKDSDGVGLRLKTTALLLFLLLITQVLYHYKDEILGVNRYEPDKIHMVNHNVFTHPIEKGVLLISASMENEADFDQKFPILEVRLTDSQSKLVALRRFKPNEYLENYTESMLLKKNLVTNLKLKIKDPGSKATRFQFNFL